MLVVNKLHNRQPRVSVVDVVAKSRRINDRELDFELLFLKLSLDYFDLCELVELLIMTLGVVLGGGQLSREEGVNESCLPEPGLACAPASEQRSEKEYEAHSPTTIMVKWAPRFATILCL